MAEDKKLARSNIQNRKLHAICNDVWQQLPLIPYKRSFALEAWKKLFIQVYVRSARWEAYHTGTPDPFPIRPVPSSQLSARQMSELIDSTIAWCSQNGIDIQ